MFFDALIVPQQMFAIERNILQKFHKCYIPFTLTNGSSPFTYDGIEFCCKYLYKAISQALLLLYMFKTNET